MAFIDMQFEGLDELQKQFEALATETEVAAVEKKIVTRCRDIAAAKMRGKIPRSMDNSKSGRKGYRPGAHAADNVPTSIKSSNGSPAAVVGWENVNRTKFFYLSFVEWGTYAQSPRDFVYSTINECWASFNKVAEEEMTAFVIERLGE